MAMFRGSSAAVLGGGIAGCTVAAELARSGRVSVTLFERAPRLGGLHRSERAGGFVFDIGAFVFVEGHSIAPAKIEDLGLDLREVIKEVTDGAEFIEVKLQAELADFTISELERSRDAHGTGRHAG